MDDTSYVTVTKSNIFVDFITAWVYILLYALKGAKFVLFDGWVLLGKNVYWKLEKSFQKIKTENQDADIFYEKTKINKDKKTKKYRYSRFTMNYYNKMKVKLTEELQRTGNKRDKEPNIYVYTAKNPDGKIISDHMSGLCKMDINSFLVNEGYEVYSIKTSKTINFLYRDSALFASKISTKKLVFWLTQLSTYLKAGMTLQEAIKILTLQSRKDKHAQRVYQSIAYELMLGNSFSNALALQGTYFPPLLINMVKAAEAAGNLQETLEDLSKYYTEVNTTRKDMISALTYPAIIMIFSIAVLTFIILYVVPQFTSIYAQSDVKISGLTAAIINFSGFLSQNFVFIVFFVIVAIFVCIVLYNKAKGFRTVIQIFFMHMPVIKNVIIYKELNIFAKTFASLLRNNVYITESVDILSKITTNEVYKAILFKTVSNIVRGERISDAFKDHWAVPEVAYYMIVTGEDTSKLSDMMQKVSDYYQEMHKTIVNSLKSFVEPVMIVCLAVMVAIIILAVIVPMFNLYNSLLN